jgi:hypothetical protein
LTAREPTIAWVDVKGMRNHLAHRYFDAAHAIVADTVTVDLPPLVAATKRLLESLTPRPDRDAAPPSGVNQDPWITPVNYRSCPTRRRLARPSARARRSAGSCRTRT